MESLLKSYKKYGEVKGNVIISDATESECTAANSIITPKKPFSPPNIRFKLTDFEKGIKSTVYPAADIKELLEIYFGFEIKTNKEKQLSDLQKKQDFQQEFKNKYTNTACYKWLQFMFSEHKFGYNTLIKEFNTDFRQASILLNNTCIAVNSRYDKISEPVQLAVLSAEITGNSHYFDRNTTAGKLLIHALAFLSETPEYKNAEQIKTVYSYFLIEPDSLSNAVAAVNIRLFYSTNVQHPAYKIFADTGEICLISAANLINIRYADSDSKTVFIVENQMVFSALSETATKNNSALLCTSGQIKSAGLKLIDMLMENKCNIYYAGDFDPEGIQIAENLLHRYNSDRFHIWRMAAEDYISIEKSNEEISNQRLKKL